MNVCMAHEPAGVEGDVQLVCGQRQERVIHQPGLQVGSLLLGSLEPNAVGEYQFLALNRHPRDQKMDLAIGFVFRQVRRPQQRVHARTCNR